MVISHKRISVRVVSPGQETTEIDAVLFGEHYAYHPQVLNGNRPSTMSWTITHVPSGIAVWTTEHWYLAALATGWLARKSPLPLISDRHELLNWLRAHSAEVQDLALHINQIAPRLVFAPKTEP